VLGGFLLLVSDEAVVAGCDGLFLLPQCEGKKATLTEILNEMLLGYSH